MALITPMLAECRAFPKMLRLHQKQSLDQVLPTSNPFPKSLLYLYREAVLLCHASLPRRLPSRTTRRTGRTCNASQLGVDRNLVIIQVGVL